MGKNNSISLPKHQRKAGESPGRIRGAVIPVGPHFQADLSKLTDPADKESDASRWLGTRIWPVESTNPQENMDSIGRGRADVCDCKAPGSSKCVKRHVDEEKMRLQGELGPAYNIWKFNEMGADAANSWTLEEIKKFESIEKRCKDFLGPAVKALPSQNRDTIVRYYLNIIVPRKIRLKTRKLGLLPTQISTDADEDSEMIRASSSGSHRTRKRSLDETQPAGRRYLKRPR